MHTADVWFVFSKFLLHPESCCKCSILSDLCHFILRAARTWYSLSGMGLHGCHAFGLGMHISLFNTAEEDSWLVDKALEVIGYVGRVLVHVNPFDNNAFLIYLICVTIAPALLTAAIYLCLARIVTVYGAHLSWIRPRTYTLIFCSCDLLSLVLQGLGGGIAATANSTSGKNLGKNIMVAGLVFQVASLLLFAACCGEFAWRLRKNKAARNPKFTSLVESRLFKYFLCGMEHSVALPKIQETNKHRPRSRCPYHLHPKRLSSRRTQRRVQRQIVQRGDSIHDSRGSYGHYRMHSSVCFSSWACLPGFLAWGRLHLLDEMYS